MAVSRNGLGLNDLCLFSTSLPCPGGVWTYDLDSSLFPSGSMGGLVYYIGALDPGFVFQGEEFLVDFINGVLVGGSFGTLATGGGIGIINDPSILGLVVTAQAFVIPVGTTFQLCNAIDLTIGF